MANYFEVVGEGGVLPTRATKGSAGYDLYVSKDTIVKPYLAHAQALEMYMYEDDYGIASLDAVEKATQGSDIMGTFRPTLVPTGVACHLDEGYYLEITVRSSTPLKYWLIMANSKGVIDSDFYPNPMYLQLINLSPYPIRLKAGDRIAQAIIHKYEVVDNEVTPEEERTSGFGSTGAGI